MINQSVYDQKIVCRLEEFLASSTHWHRSLWNLGATSAISELLEASESLTETSLRTLQSEVQRLAGPDLAIGNDKTKHLLNHLLKNSLVYGQTNWQELKQLHTVISTDYLKRWASILRNPSPPGVERVARSIAGYLLHLGFSSTYLHRWLTFQTKYRPESLSIAEFVEEAHNMTLIVKQPFKVIIPVLSVPRLVENPPSEWHEASDVANMIKNIQGERSDIRQNGGFLLSINACDQYSAVEQARNLVERWSARAELATGRGIRMSDKAWVEGYSKPVEISFQEHQVEIGTIKRQNIIYASLQEGTSIRIDEALQLVQPMRMGPPSTSISGGWAAVECLLTDAGEIESLASNRLANIIACSFPRAELTTLAYSHRLKGKDALAESLKKATNNLQMARILADAIFSGSPIIGQGPHDDAAYDRMRELLVNPEQTLNKVHDYVNICLNKLYRQRNLMLHGGRVQGEERFEVLLTASPLVGAGLDRIAHAWFVENTSPIMLAARAEINLHLVGSNSGRHITELLEPI